MIGESIKKSLYGDIPVTQLSEEQKQTLIALGSLASGLAGGLASGDETGAMAGAQAGKNELSNNMMGMGMLSQMLAQETLNSAAMAEAGKGGANEQAALALTKKVKAGLDTACLQNAGCVLMAIVAAQNQAGPNGPSHTGGDQTAGPGLSNTGGNQLPEQGENHTGNNSGQTHVGPNNTGGNQTVEQSPSNTGNTGDVPDLPNYMESQGYDPRLPIPKATTASNGLRIESNSKHTPGAQGFRPNAGIEPKDSLDIFEHSIQTKDPKVRLSIDSSGNIHRFFNTSKDGSGSFHWSGSTGDGKNALGNRELGSFNKEIRELRGMK